MTETEDYPPDNSDIAASILGGVSHEAMRWRHAQVTLDDARGHLISAVRKAAAAGVSEYALASAAGVTRVTIRSWLGKGRGNA